MTSSTDPADRALYAYMVPFWIPGVDPVHQAYERERVRRVADQAARQLARRAAARWGGVAVLDVMPGDVGTGFPTLPARRRRGLAFRGRLPGRLMLAIYGVTFTPLDAPPFDLSFRTDDHTLARIHMGRPIALLPAPVFYPWGARVRVEVFQPSPALGIAALVAVPTQYLQWLEERRDRYLDRDEL